ncbi:MAG: xanthine phosphoribosyltransferase [Clostridia bacterium]|nr:xanthine phosphoribosyltransferase [Clostridia bacterium]
MEALEQKILDEGTVLSGNILKVGSFLNQQLDVGFLLKMGEEIGRIYKGDEITKILTIEASGIAVAVAAAAVMGNKVVFAKKNKTSNVSGEVYSAKVHSFTHGTDYLITVPKEYIKKSDKVLIIDDFLANGNALIGLIDIINQAGAEVVGCTCAIEKGFQGGGDKLRKKGYRIESLAVIEKMSAEGIEFRR